MIVKLACEICSHEVCTVDTDLLKLPLYGSMFGPPEDWMPNPFDPSVDWVWMRCPMCQKRPFIKEGHFTTAAGSWLRVNKRGAVSMPVVEKTMEQCFGEIVEGSEASNAHDEAWAQAIGGATPRARVKTVPKNSDAKKVEGKKGSPTLADEVMRLHGLGMKPGQISRELKKNDIDMHHLQIAQKIKELKREKAP